MVKMVVKLVILLTVTVLEVTSSFIPPQHTTTGRRFVFSFPMSSHKVGTTDSYRNGMVRLYTDQPKAFVSGSYIHDIEIGKERLYFNRTISRLRSVWLLFSPVTIILSKTGTFQVFEMQADVPISSVLYTQAYGRSFGSGYRLSPIEVWSTSYYVSSIVGYPFFAVMSANDPVKGHVVFGSYKYKFNSECITDRTTQCRPKQRVEFALQAFRVWNVLLNEHSNVQNTFIKSDKPVFVISGNNYFKLGSDIDSGVMSVSPVSAWGKEYVTPFFNNSPTLIYRINAKKLPFQFTIVYLGKKTSHTFNDLDKDERIMNYKGAAIFAAKIPFGLSVYGHHESQPDCILVIPTEQWMAGFNFNRQANLNIKDTALLGMSAPRIITTSLPDQIAVDGKGSIQWDSYVQLGVNTYHYGAVAIKAYPVSVYSMDPKGRLIVYTVLKTTYTASYFPETSYQAEIYDEKCKRKDPIVSDGIDNDCDGYVDEEVNNGMDDDGDGLIDEDTLEKPGHHEWGPWTTVCSMICGAKKYVKKIRDCKINEYGYTKGTTCGGKSEMCEPGIICPKTCQPTSNECKCQPGCKTCVSPKSYQCSACKEGFFGEFCLLKCPNGWRGTNCLLPPRPTDYKHFGTMAEARKKVETAEKKEREREEKKRKEMLDRERTIQKQKQNELKEKIKKDKASGGGGFLPWMIPPLALVDLLLLVLFLFKKKKEEEENLDEEEKVEEEERIEENHIIIEEVHNIELEEEHGGEKGEHGGAEVEET